MPDLAFDEGVTCLSVESFAFNAKDVLSAAIQPQGRAGVWFLNWSVRPVPIEERPHQPNAFKGPGLYALSFQDQLIYIGSYLGADKKAASVSGDVVAARWFAHIGSITARGDRVHVARGTLRKLREDVAANNPLQAIHKGDIERLTRDAGCLSPARRLLFAAKHSAVFLEKTSDPAEVLSMFRFEYCRFTSLAQGMDPSLLGARLVQAEKKLIKLFAPVCNSSGVPKGKDPIMSDSNQIREDFIREMRSSATGTN